MMNVGLHHCGVDPQLGAILQPQPHGRLDHQFINGLQGLRCHTNETAVKGVMFRHRRAVKVGELTQCQPVGVRAARDSPSSSAASELASEGFDSASIRCAHSRAFSDLASDRVGYTRSNPPAHPKTRRWLSAVAPGARPLSPAASFPSRQNLTVALSPSTPLSPSSSALSPVLALTL